MFLPHSLLSLLQCCQWLFLLLCDCYSQLQFSLVCHLTSSSCPFGYVVEGNGFLQSPVGGCFTSSL